MVIWYFLTCIFCSGILFVKFKAIIIGGHLNHPPNLIKVGFGLIWCGEFKMRHVSEKLDSVGISCFVLEKLITIILSYLLYYI